MSVNKLPALRVGDGGIHAACCGKNAWAAHAGAPTVFINNKSAHRVGDATRHCGGIGRLIEGSPNVVVGDMGGGGGGAAVPTPPGQPTRGGGEGAGASLASTARVGAVDDRAPGSGVAGSGKGRIASDPSRTFLDLVMIDQHDRPFGGHRFVVTDSDGGEHSGHLDDAGRARIDGLPPGTCSVAFPDLAPDDWGEA